MAWRYFKPFLTLALEFHRINLITPSAFYTKVSTLFFTPTLRFFKKREGVTRLKKPHGDDADSVEDVDDDEFDRLLGKSTGRNTACSTVVL